MNPEQTEAIEPQPEPLSRKLLAIALFYLAAFAILVIGQLQFPMRLLEGFFFLIGMPMALVVAGAVYGVLGLAQKWLKIERERIVDVALLSFVSFSVASTLVFVVQFDDLASTAVEAIAGDARGKCVSDTPVGGDPALEPCAALATQIRVAVNAYVEHLYLSEAEEDDASLARQRRLLEAVQQIAEVSTIDAALARELTAKLQ